MREARAMFQKALDIMDIPMFNFIVGWSLYHDKKYEEAIPYFKNARINDTLDVGVHLAYLSNAHFKLNKADESNAYLDQLKARINNGDRSLIMAMAIVSAEQDSKENTIAYLEKAYALKEPMMTYLFSLDPLFKPLKNNVHLKRIWSDILGKPDNFN